MRTFILFSVLLTLWLNTTTGQNLWVVNNDPLDSNADFDNIQEAVDSADAGDKIYVTPSALAYDSVIVTKRIHLIGVGGWFVQNGIPVVSTLVSGISGVLRLDPGSDSSIVEGIFCYAGSWAGLQIATDNIFIRHTYCNALQFVNNPVNAFIWASYIEAGISGPASNAKIYNSVVRCSWLHCGENANREIWVSNAGSTNCEMRQINSGPGDYAGGSIRFQNVTLRNSIINRTVTLFTNCIVEYNVFSNTPPGVDTTNLTAVNMSTVLDVSNPSPDGRYQLVGDSITNVAFGAGEFGEDCGIFGGDNPYKLSLIPGIPTVNKLFIPIMGDTSNMLKVKVKAKSN